ncbi:MAG: hypothetical protein A4E68_02277 [Syntrophaceae bacterium PtaB.Bin095]|nr:MAG: hypothetical protein A4E68_02277 [Syntrophaceae bacterium PtaB.Bin095]
MKARGFTLIELLVALAVCIIIIGAIYAAVTTGQRSSAAMLQKVVAHQDARAALELMATDIQMTSFNPTRAAGIWRTPTGACTVVSGNQNARGIQEATATSIAIEMDVGVSGAIGDSASEVIRYAYLPDAANQRITRSTNCGTAQPFLGSSVAGQKTVRVINDVNGNGTMDAGDLPVFRYYTALGTEIPVANFLNPATSPNIRDIARIEITLSVETEDVAADTGQRRQMIYSTSIIPRNHVIP